MKLFLFNSLTNQLDCLVLSKKKPLNIYLCGPTVYEHIHLGNLRPVIVFDVLHRFLLHLGYQVKYVHNLTDIDDKIIEKAQRVQKKEWQISQRYLKAYFQNLVGYQVLRPTFTPKVTDYIGQIQEFLRLLQQKKSAYQEGNNLLFSLKNQPTYGQLSNQKKEQLSQRLVAPFPKQNFQDFFLWKSSEKGQSWPYLGGQGRPGWHSECATFVHHFFAGQTIDIHGGGQDLLFPHHENERIQYWVANQRELSRIWLHVAHLKWASEKMSKSQGNVIRAKKFLAQYGANVLRYLFLNSHYQQVINFTPQLVQQAVNYQEKISNLLKRLKLHFYWQKKNWESFYLPSTNSLYQLIIQALANNLNTIKVFYYLEVTIQKLNQKLNHKLVRDSFEELVSILYFILDLLGFKFQLTNYNWEVRYLLEKWKQFRQEKNFLLADQIRKKLIAKEVI